MNFAGDAASIGHYVDVDDHRGAAALAARRADAALNSPIARRPCAATATSCRITETLVHVVLSSDPPSRPRSRRLRHSLMSGCASLPAVDAAKPPKPAAIAAAAAQAASQRRRPRATARAHATPHLARRARASPTTTAVAAAAAAAAAGRAALQAVRRRRQGREAKPRASSRSGRRTTRSGIELAPDQFDQPFFFKSANLNQGIGENRLFGGADDVPGRRRRRSSSSTSIGQTVQLIAQERQVHGQGGHAGGARRRRPASPTACSPPRRSRRSRIRSASPC